MYTFNARDTRLLCVSFFFVFQEIDAATYRVQIDKVWV